MTRYKTLFGIVTAAVSVVAFVGSVFTSGERGRSEHTEPAATVRYELDAEPTSAQPWPRRLLNRLEQVSARYIDPIFRNP